MTLFSQTSVEDSNWNLYLSYQNATRCVAHNGLVYGVLSGNLISYDTETEEVRLFSSLNGLGSKGIYDIAYSDAHDCLVVLYEDYHIDLVYDDGDRIVGIPGLKGTEQAKGSINSLFVGKDNIIVSNNSGIGVISLRYHNVAGFYTFGEVVTSAAEWQDCWWVSTAKALYVCKISDNPYDRNSWKLHQTMNVHQFAMMGNYLYANIYMSEDESLGNMCFAVMDPADQKFYRIAEGAYTTLRATNNRVISGSGNFICEVLASAPKVLHRAINNPNTWKDIFPVGENKCWVTSGEEGCMQYEIVDYAYQATSLTLPKFGPQRDLCFFTKYVGDRLLIAGGRLDPYDVIHYDPTAMIYENGEWTFFQNTGISDITKTVYRDLSTIAQDPLDPTHHFISAAGTGLYEFKDFKFVKQYTVDNSPLQSAVPKEALDIQKMYTRIDGLSFDAEGNLWMINNQVDSLIRVLKKDGTWKSFYIESVKQAPTCMRTIIDSKGRLWMGSRRTVGNHDGGLLCLDCNGTIDNTKDDVAHYRSSFTNQDGTTYSLQGVYDMAEDKDGSIWVATLNGVFVIDTPDDWAKSSFTVTQPKIPRNDGTNYADYLLGEAQVSAVAVDGAGQKWLGTVGSGVYVTTPDGSEILHHFTAENSPLLSNQIHSISPNLSTGEVMIGTEAGLCSYQSKTSLPAESLDKDNIKVYPNPVRPDYHGDITITGLPENADVKIVNTSGRTLYGGTSAGGTFTWDCRATDGGRVGAGVYYIMVATEDGKKGVAAKFVVI